ncbi:MAG: hypothetical protein AAF581_19315 [Planctomycetota bacterium]
MRIVAMLALVAGLMGCSASAPDIKGNWTVDAESMKLTEDYKKMPEAQQQMMDVVMESMKVDITADKIIMKMSFMGQEQTEEASYKITKTEGNKLTVETTDKDGKTESKVIEVDGDKLNLPDDDGVVMVLRRV